MNDRIKALRKTLKLTQQGFADRLGVKRNTVAQWEIGVNNLSDQVTRAVCREFNVSETWLRTGEGEMFVPKAADALDELVKQYGLSDGDHILIEKFLKLKPAERQSVITYMKDVVAALNAGTDLSAAPTFAPGTSSQAQTERDATEPEWTAEEHVRWEREARDIAQIAYDQYLYEKKQEAGLSASPGDSGGEKLA